LKEHNVHQWVNGFIEILSVEAIHELSE
jgi:hypothetical protein